MLLVGTSYQQESSPLIHPVLQPRRQRRDAARENGEDVRPRAGVGRQDRTLPQAAGAGMQSLSCHYNLVGIELSTDEVWQWQEKAHIAIRKCVAQEDMYWACLFFLLVCSAVNENQTNRPNRHGQYISSCATQCGHEIGTLVRKYHNQQAVWFARSEGLLTPL